MTRALISDRGRSVSLVAIAVSVVVALVLAALVWHGTTTSFDTWAFDRAYLDFPRYGTTGRSFWLWFSEPVISLAVPTVVSVWALLTRQRNVAVLAVVGPLAALAITELIGKPFVDRALGPHVLQGSLAGAVHGSYPSGHETALVSWLVLAVVVAFRSPLRARARSVIVVVAVLWALAGAVGLTVNFYHYATDTIGAIGVSTAVVLGLALLIDRLTPTVERRLSSPAARTPPRTSRGS